MLESRKTYLFNKSMIYKMVATLADFDPKYRALDEIVLDSAGMEASSIANFGGIKNEGTFFTNPGYIDALSQSAGFVMNANERSNLELEVFVNHGWEAFQLFETLTPDKPYETHVTMSEMTGKMWKGDVFVLDENRVVALFKGIAVSHFTDIFKWKDSSRAGFLQFTEHQAPQFASCSLRLTLWIVARRRTTTPPLHVVNRECLTNRG